MLENLISLIFFSVIAGVVLSYLTTGRRVRMSEINFSLGLIMVAILVIFIIPLMSETIHIMGSTKDDCVRMDTVNCEIYNIPLDTCNMTKEIVGPFYDEKEITTYWKETCVLWESGKRLEP